MLSSIHPLGERARNNKWGVTVVAFTIAAVAAGALVGTVAGWIGSVALTGVDASARLVITALALVVAGGLDLARIRVPGPHRQVNESWIGAYRGWVYGAGFGLQLGLGVVTFVVTWTTYAMFAAQVLTVAPATGALVGAVFGLGRSTLLLLAGYVDRPTRLTAFNSTLVRSGPMVRVASALGMVALGSLALIAGVA